MEYHVGPYVECRNVEVEKTTKVYCCVNKGCMANNVPVGHTFAWCPRCGSAIGSIQEPTKERAVNWMSAMNAIDDALAGVDIDGNPMVYWLPNHSRDQPRDFSPENEHAFPVDDWVVTSELRWFVGAFGPEIEVLNGLYGAENVKVRWGVVAYYS